MTRFGIWATGFLEWVHAAQIVATIANQPQGISMQVSFLRLPLLAFVLATAAAPSLAGNYAEGDPRPIAFTSSASRSVVAADARNWMATAPTVGYTEGNPRPVFQVSQNSRAVVQADTMNWIRSGLASVQYGEAGADGARPSYLQAARAYADLHGTAQDARASRSPAKSATVVR